MVFRGVRHQRLYWQLHFLEGLWASPSGALTGYPPKKRTTETVETWTFPQTGKIIYKISSVAIPPVFCLRGKKVKRLKTYTPENQHGTWKWTPGRGGFPIKKPHHFQIPCYFSGGQKKSSPTHLQNLQPIPSSPEWKQRSLVPKKKVWQTILVSKKWSTGYLVGGFNQPLWKIWSSNWIIPPGFRDENKKYLSCHQPATVAPSFLDHLSIFCPLHHFFLAQAFLLVSSDPDMNEFLYRSYT